MGAAKRNAGREAPVAKHGKDFVLRRAGQASLRQPSRHLGKKAFVHCQTIQPQAGAFGALTGDKPADLPV